MSTITKPASTASSTTPPVGVAAEPIPVRKRRRPVRTVAILIALIIVGVLLNVWLFMGSRGSSSVLAVAQPVLRGEVIEAADLSTVQAPKGDGLQTINASRSDLVVGQRAAVDLVPGATLTMASVTDALVPASGQALVGLDLMTGKLPASDLGVGDIVAIVVTPRDQDDPPTENPSTISATVAAVRPSEEGDGRTTVDVSVPSNNAPVLAAQAATGRVSLILTSRER